MNRVTLTSAAALALMATPAPAVADGWLDGIARQVAGQAIQQGANAALSGAFKRKPKTRAEDQPAAPAPAPALAAPATQVEGVSSEVPFAEPGAPAPAKAQAAPAAKAAPAKPAAK